jgi:GNAT superfamily N-acetyltransferase
VTADVRPAHLADIFRLQEIERAAAELFRGSPLIDVASLSVISMADHERSIDEGLSFVGEVNGRSVGFVMGEMQGRDAYMRELDVDPPFQKRGIGAQLVKHFAGAAHAKGAQAVYLSTFRSPPWNAPFYRKLGFRDVSRSDYLPWMTSIWQEQSTFLDMNTRVFMKLRW